MPQKVQMDLSTTNLNCDMHSFSNKFLWSILPVCRTSQQWNFTKLLPEVGIKLRMLKPLRENLQTRKAPELATLVTAKFQHAVVTKTHSYAYNKPTQCTIFSFYYFTTPLHVSGPFVAHHQEAECIMWQMVLVLGSWFCALYYNMYK
jgi:hypothetical protein